MKSRIRTKSFRIHNTVGMDLCLCQHLEAKGDVGITVHCVCGTVELLISLCVQYCKAVSPHKVFFIKYLLNK
jgi:hypothetical protein